MPKIRLFLNCIVFLFSSSAIAADWLYSVRPGDTIWDICLKYTTKAGCWQTLPDINKISRTKQLPPGFIVRIPIEWLKTQPKPATVRYLIGEVWVELGGTTEKLLLGDKLAIGSVIKTKQGYVNLELADGSMVSVEPQSILSLDAFSSVEDGIIVDSQLRLRKGSVRAKVKKRKPKTRFEITTPAAVAAVRGTQYRVSSTSQDQPSMRSEVLQGRIDVSNALTTQGVPEGFGITAIKDEKISAPVKLLEAVEFVSKQSPHPVPSTILWKENVKAKNYVINILNDNERDEIIRSETVSTGRLEINDLAEGCYKLVIKAVDVNHLIGLPALKKICVTPKIPTPILKSSNTALSANYVEATWNEHPSALNYRVQIASDAEFSHLLLDGTIFENTLSYKTSKPIYVRVQALGFEGQRSDFSNSQHFIPGPSKKKNVFF